jgi:hypothetical protein
MKQVPRENIIQWIVTNFPDHKIRKNGEEYRINNPFDGDTGYHLEISVDKAVCHDWRGDEWAHGGKPTFIRLVQLYKKCSYAQAMEEVVGHVNYISEYKRGMLEDKVEPEKSGIELPENCKPIIESNGQIVKYIVGWLKSRGVDVDMIKKYDIRHAGYDVIWPYYEYDMLVYWQARHSINKMFRFPPESTGVSKGMFIYGFDYVEPSDYIIITEAIFGAHTLGGQAVATGGADMTTRQVLKIRALNPVNGIILAPDSDEAGLKSIIRNFGLLSPYFQKIHFALPPPIEFNDAYVKDWNELGQAIGFNNVRKRFEDCIKPITMKALDGFAMGIF